MNFHGRLNAHVGASLLKTPCVETFEHRFFLNIFDAPNHNPGMMPTQERAPLFSWTFASSIVQAPYTVDCPLPMQCDSSANRGASTILSLARPNLVIFVTLGDAGISLFRLSGRSSTSPRAPFKLLPIAFPFLAHICICIQHATATLACLPRMFAVYMHSIYPSSQLWGIRYKPYTIDKDRWDG